MPFMKLLEVVMPNMPLKIDTNMRAVLSVNLKLGITHYLETDCSLTYGSPSQFIFYFFPPLRILPSFLLNAIFITRKYHTCTK